MAGIGFDLKKLLHQGTLSKTLSAYFYTALVTSGPWLFSVIALGLISGFGRFFTTELVLNQFVGLTIYAFAGSMVVTGGSQLVITRHVSDCIYRGEEEKVASIFMETWVMGIGIALVTGIPLLATLGLPFDIALQCFALYLLTILMWLSMIFVSAVKAYLRIVWAFLIGFALSVPGALVIGSHYGLQGLLAGLNSGISLIVFVLAGSVLIEFKGPLLPSLNILEAHRKYWLLFLTGLLASTGIWADKILVWFILGKNFIGPLKSFPVYDGAMFISYLTVLPSLAYFVMIIETDFYRGYRSYFHLVESKVPFLSLELAKKDMLKQLRTDGYVSFIIQFILTAIFLYMSPWLIAILNINPLSIHIFRIGCIGAFFHMASSQLGIILAYFDARLEMFLVSLVYFVVLSIGTVWSTSNLWNLGYGYVAAGILASIVSIVLVFQRTKKLHYYTLIYPKIAVD